MANHCNTCNYGKKRIVNWNPQTSQSGSTQIRCERVEGEWLVDEDYGCSGWKEKDNGIDMTVM